LERAQFILTAIGEVEDDIFKKRQRTELEFRQRAKDKKRRNQNYGDMPQRMPEWMKSGPYAPTPLGQSFVKPVATANKFEALEATNAAGASNESEMTEEEKRGIKRKHPNETSQASASQESDECMKKN
jgi:5'-3' exoribonuclease 2